VIRKTEESIGRLIKHGIIEEVAPERYRVTTRYLDEFRRSVTEVLQDEVLKGKKDVYGLALVLTLGRMFDPDPFTKYDVAALEIVHENELGLK